MEQKSGHRSIEQLIVNSRQGIVNCEQYSLQLAIVNSCAVAKFLEYLYLHLHLLCACRSTEDNNFEYI